MRKTEAVEVNGSTYVVCELTPREIDQLYDQSRNRDRGLVDDILDVHCLDTVLLGSMLGEPPEAVSEIVGGYTTSEYMPIIEAAKRLNPDFFAMARRRIEYAGQLANLSGMLDKISGNGSPSSSSTGTTTPGTTA